ncbi:hypothetical protein [Kocuria sp. NPDC057446]|uniref:hypothetical protein n=1 Tax=Kocuria sp. NPDC057446 TaxID=3346137 RepID=UPI0036D08561
MSTPSTAAHDSTTDSPDAVPCSCLDPAQAFPGDLEGLSMSELQVLHSRICRQLDRDYLTGPGGPHPCTADRLQDVLDELDARDAA